MTVTLEVRISDLFPEFFANTLVLLAVFQTAGAVTAGALETFPDRCNHFFVFVQPNGHKDHILSTNGMRLASLRSQSNVRFP